SNSTIRRLSSMPSVRFTTRGGPPKPISEKSSNETSRRPALVLRSSRQAAGNRLQHRAHSRTRARSLRDEGRPSRQERTCVALRRKRILVRASDQLLKQRCEFRLL